MRFSLQPVSQSEQELGVTSFRSSIFSFVKKVEKIWPCSPSIALSLDKKATRLRRSKSKMRVIIAPDWCSGPATQGGQVGIARDLIFLFQKVGKLKKVENFQSIRRLSSPKSVKSESKKFT